MQPTYGQNATNERPPESLTLRYNKARAMAKEAIARPILSPEFETRPLRQANLRAAVTVPRRGLGTPAAPVAVTPLDFPR